MGAIHSVIKTPLHVVGRWL